MTYCSWGEKWGTTIHDHGVSCVDDENALKLIAVITAQLCEQTKNQGTVYFKWVPTLGVKPQQISWIVVL